jgi:hypothetical protein
MVNYIILVHIENIIIFFKFMRAGRAGALAMGGKKRYEVYQDKPSVELSNKNLGILIH